MSTRADDVMERAIEVAVNSLDAGDLEKAESALIILFGVAELEREERADA